jgi:two-component system cell cycle sensor histidine kinase/response regulator CckA
LCSKAIRIDVSRRIYRIGEVVVGSVSVFALALIVLGAVVMTLNIVRFKAIPKTLNQISDAESRRLRRAFGFLLILMTFFLCGYLATFYGIMTDSQWMGDLFVGIVFFLGAVFVLLSVLVQTNMLTSIRENYRDMIASGLRLGESNKQLKSEMFERKRTEEELKDAHGELEQRVSERTKDLRSLNEQLDSELRVRRQAEQALRESERRYRTLFEDSSDAIYINSDGRLIDVNQAMLDLFGYTKEEMIGMEVSRAYADPTDRSEVLKRLNQGHAKDYEVTFKKKDGTLMDCLLTASARRAEDRTIMGYQGIIRDVTEKKLAEEALRKSEERYRSVVEGSMQGIGVFRDGIIQLVNRAAARIFGYSDPKELVGKNFYEALVEPEERSQLKERARTLLGGTQIAVHPGWQGIRSDGTRIWVQSTASLIYWQDQPAMLGFFVDVTERIEAEESLRRERDRAQKYLDIAGVMLVALDTEGRVTMINKRGSEILGWDEEEILGTSWFETFMPGEAREPVWNTFKELLAGRVEPVEYFENRIVTKAGENRDMAWHNTILKNSNDDIVGTLSSGEDITERKRAEMELRESEEKYRTVVEGSSDAILMLDRDREIVSSNRAFLDLFGYKQDEVAGQSVRIIHPSDSSFRTFGQAAYPIIESRRSFRAEWEFARKDGKIIPAETVTSIMNGPDGSTRGYVAIIRDITEKQQIQSQLQEAQKMEAIGTLAGGIAHDFNNLLTTIQGNASLMLLDADPGQRQYASLKNIQTQVRSGAKLTAQLLGYARKGKYEAKPVDFNALVKDVSEAFGRTRKEVTIQRELAVDLPAIEADEGQMEQLLLNLFVNAADAMPAGGDLTLKTSHARHEEMRGRLYDPKPGSYVSLAITDTGLGMDKQTQERVFEPFFTTKEMGCGTGLGLASVYGIAKSHGGYIDVESEEGQGTTFTVFLPVSKQTLPVRVESAGQVLVGSETVLIVDDEELVLKVGANMLEKLGYNVHKANGGREAIEIYRENSRTIDLVILDMIMPQLGGGQVYDEMKETNPHVKVLLSSGYAVEGQADDILSRGCDGFIQKPFTIEDLSQKVRELLVD